MDHRDLNIVDAQYDAYLGLFGRLGSSGVIKNVGVVNSYVKGTGRPANVGGVCGYSASGDIFNSYNAGTVEGGESAKVGGVCGEDSSIPQTTSMISNCYNVGLVTGERDAKVGGVCGKKQNLTITDCIIAS